MRFDPAPAGGSARRDQAFVLYVEGARDREILRGWASRLAPAQKGRISGSVVILGGRQPARAVQHFRDVADGADGARGLCVLDRDDGRASALPDCDASGLEFFTWTRRHIESYLLVPAAIHRALRVRNGDSRLSRLLAAHLPPADDEEAFRAVDAKKLIGPKGVISRGVSRSIRLADVARATREDELHPDVHDLFSRLRDALGVPTPPLVYR